MARAEACLRLAGASGPAVLPEAHPSCRRPRARERLRRSRLYLPGNRPKLMLSAGLYGADGLILDLEDSVTPADKDAARLLVRNALIALDWGSSERMVRVNQGELGPRGSAPDRPPQPPCRAAAQGRGSGAGAPGRGARCARSSETGAPFLMPILESPLGIHRAFEIASRR